jgi:hypothetical protein
VPHSAERSIEIKHAHCGPTRVAFAKA